MANKNSLVIQDLTYTQLFYGNAVTVSYVNGSALAVSVSGFDITVTITPTSTANQIKAAVNADAAASLLVLVTGSSTTIQLTCKNAALSGGVTAATKGTVDLGDIRYTEHTAGTSLNDVRIRYTAGATAGSEVVTVSTHDISIQIANGVSTIAQIQAAVAGSGPAAALVDTTALKSPTTKQYVAAASSYTTIGAGSAAAAATVVNQDLTYSTDATDASLNGKTISYTTGATAGAEVVSVASGNVSVQIENGVSTATQIETALNASAAFVGVAPSGAITVVDYAKGHLTAATGSFAVVDYTKAGAVKASGTITVTNYALLHKTKASVVIQDLTYTAVAFGPGGNSIAVQYVDAGAIGNNAVVEVVGNDIIVNMDPTAVTGSSATTIKNAVNADAEANLLVLVTGAAATVQTVQVDTPLVGGLNASTVTANGTVLTESVDFNAVTSNDQTATNIAAAIDGVALLDAAAATNVVTITAATAGTAGNSLTLATSDAVNLAKSGSVLANGRNAMTVTVAGHVLTANSDWTAATSNQVTADNLTTAIDNLTEVSATDAAGSSTTITITATPAGTSGNSVALATSNTAAVTKSGAALTGGVAALVVVVGSTTLTESTDFNFTGSNNTSATNLASAIDGISGINAAAIGAVVTAKSDTTSTTDNGKVLTSSNVLAATSPGTFTGGTNSYTVSISGTGSTAQKTVNGATLTGAVGTGSFTDFYQDQSIHAATSSFVNYQFGCNANNIVFHNDETSGAKALVYSFDGINTHGILLATESLVLTGANRSQVWIKYNSAAPAYRITASGN